MINRSSDTHDVGAQDKAKNAKLRILMITGLGDDKYIAEAHAAGVDAVVFKPFCGSELHAALLGRDIPERVRHHNLPQDNRLASVALRATVRTYLDCLGNKTQAADKLGMSRGKLQHVLAELERRARCTDDGEMP